VQRAELLDHEEPEDDNRPAGVQEILPPLPQAHAAQRGQIDLVIGKFCNLGIETPGRFQNYRITQLQNYQFMQGRKLNGQTAGLQNRTWGFESLRPCQSLSAQR
jgi:hypothetical protein